MDGSRERKGARRQRFLIQINTEPRLSAPLLLSHVDCSNPQWRFQHPLGGGRASDWRPRSSRSPNNLLALPSARPLFVYSPRIAPFCHPFTPPSLTVRRTAAAAASPGHRGAHSWSHKKRPSRIAFLPSACELAARLR